MRGLAALTVMAGHTRELFFASLAGTAAAASTVALASQKPEAKSITIGNEAVMIFFVLSGYLVGGSVLRSVWKGNWSWRTYLGKRLTRLWVVLIPAILFSVALDNVGLRAFPEPTSVYAPPPELQEVPAGYRAHLGPATVAGNMLFLQTIAVPTAGTNSALWSLANEFWYYIAFPLLVLLLSRGTGLSQRLLYFALLAVLAWGVAGAVGGLFPIWILGAAVSALPLRLPSRVARILSATMALVVLLAVVAIRRAPLPLLAAQWTIALLFALLLYAVLHQTQSSRGGWYRAIAGFFSRISYSLYATHLSLAVFLCALVNRPWHQWTKTPANLLVVLALNALLIGVGYLFYRLFESNTDKIRVRLLHRGFAEQHVPVSAPQSAH